MSAVKELKRRLRAYEADLKRRSVFLRDSDADLSFGMVMLLSDRESSTEPGFLTELRRVLIEHADRFEQGAGGENRRSEIANWLGKEHKGLHTPSNWLKLAIEQYPLRLFAVIDREDPRWKSNEHTPLDGDDFWNGKDGFFRKRICWLSAEELMKDMPEGNGHRPDEAGATVCRFLTRLRLRWIRHLAHNVSGLTGVRFLRMAFSLAGEGSSAVGSLPVPDTLPVRWRDRSGKTAGKDHGRFDVDLERLTPLKVDAWNGKIGFAPSENSGDSAFLIFSRHYICSEFTAVLQEWKPTKRVFEAAPWESREAKSTNSFLERVVFQQPISGGGRIFSLLDSGLLSWSNLPEQRVCEVPSIFLDALEQGCIRIGIADERFQAWMHDRRGENPEQERGWVISQRVVPLFLKHEAGQKGITTGQPQDYNSPHVALTLRDDSPISLTWERFDVKGLNTIWPPAPDRSLDVAITHQGLLDKLAGAGKTAERLTHWILRLKACVPLVLVTSGRGKPENLPNGCKFLPYASVEGAIHGAYFEKQVLWRGIATL